MTAEANAAIKGALAGGASRVVANDSHGTMTNIMIENLNPAAELITGRLKPLGMMQGIGPDLDAVFLAGYHAASGTGAAILEHTPTGLDVQVRLNGQEVGELGFNAAVAGTFGVPVLLDGRTVEWTGKDMLAVSQAYSAMISLSVLVMMTDRR